MTNDQNDKIFPIIKLDIDNWDLIICWLLRHW